MWGVNSELVLDPARVDEYTADPPAALEALRGKLIARIERLIDSTPDDRLSGSLAVAALKLSSIGVGKGDVTIMLERENRPDVSHLSTEDLERIVEASKTNGNGSPKS